MCMWIERLVIPADGSDFISFCSSDGLQKWTRFAVLEEKARKCGCKLKLGK